MISCRSATMGVLVRLTSQRYRRTRGWPSWSHIHFAAMLLLLMTEKTRGEDFDYNTIECEKGKHTMVLYPKGPGPSCVDYKSDKLSQPEKEAILHKHNELRNSIALGQFPPFPKAADMMEMVWDEELEMIAQRCADQCRFDIDDCNHVQRFRVGQNHAEHYFGQSRLPDVRATMNKIKNYVMKGNADPFPSPETLVDYWFEQINSSKNVAPPNPLQSDKDGNAFTQMVWGSTNHLGCAQSSYVIDKQTRKLVVCNYGPRGNEIGQVLYKVGAPCSECSCSTGYPGLCDVQKNSKRQ